METDSQEFTFLPPFESETKNGLTFNGVYLPQEIVQQILSYLEPEDLLELTLVCKHWCDIIKSNNLWMHIYNKRYPNEAKNLPWYVFYSYLTSNDYENFLQNGNGSDTFKHWNRVMGKFRIDNPPKGCQPLPPNIPDFNGLTSCFATSDVDCTKMQAVFLKNKRLLRYILDNFMPHIYISEWVAGGFSGCKYVLDIKGYAKKYKKEPLFHKTKEIVIPSSQHWIRKDWEKVEMLIEEYPPDLSTIIFEHTGIDTQFVAGYDYSGCKMAGGVVKVLFDSIQPLEEG